MVIDSKVNKAMILAAGEGIRMRPLTLETPKVLLPVGGKPLIQYTFAWLKNHGIREVAINLQHLGENIRDFIGDGSRFGITVAYSAEDTLLGTAGGVKRMGHFFEDTFVVLCGDILTNFDLSSMVRFHRKKNSLATIALFKIPNPWEVGIVELDEEGRVLSFVEKPPPGKEKGSLASGGIYVFENKILDYIPDEGSSDFAYNIFPKLLDLNLPLYGYPLKPTEYLIDIGTLEKYHRADEDIRHGKIKIRVWE